MKELKTHLSSPVSPIKKAIFIGALTAVFFGQAALGSKPDLTVKGVRILPNNANFERVDAKSPSSASSQAIAYEKFSFDTKVPVYGYVSQHFSRYHPAIDLASAYNSPITPIASGKVVQVGWDPYGKGKTVVVEHSPHLKTLYAHMSTTEVKVGDTVSSSTEIGKVGLTGHTTGPHLHFEVYEDSEMVDPENYLPAVSSSPASIAANF